MVTEDGSSPATLLRIHDLLSSARHQPGVDLLIAEGKVDAAAPIRARLHGVVTQARKGRDRCFFDLLDPTGGIQIAADVTAVDESAWIAVRGVSKGDRIYVAGVLGTAGRSGQPTLWLDEAPRRLDSVLSENLAALQPDLRRVGASLITARVADLINERLQTLGFLKVSPRFLSASWRHDGLIPLEIVYSGFGLLPVYLCPSPSAQLVEAMIATGADKVFASTTSFTTAYRTALDGVEATLLSAKTLGVDFDSLMRMALSVVDTVLEAVNQVEDRTPLSTLPVVLHAWEDAGAAELANSPQVQVFSGVKLETTDVTIFRLALGEGAFPAEGVVEAAARGLPIGTLNFYPERFLPLFEHVPMRRLQHVDDPIRR